MSLRKPVFYMALLAIFVLVLSGCSAAVPAAFSGASAQLAVPAAAAAVLPQAGAQQALPPAQTTTTPASGGISVVGIGQVSGAPDIARVTIGVQTQGADIKAAVAQNNTDMTALVATLKAAGIAEKDIQTSNYSVSAETPPVPVEAPGTSKSGTSAAAAVTYHVANQVQVTVRDLTKLSDILDKSVDSGANSIYGVSFDLSDTSKLEDQARAAAVADAKSRAEKLAQLEGVTLGSVLQVSEVSSMPGPIMYASAYGKGGGGVPIENGSIQVTINLQVTYAIK